MVECSDKSIYTGISKNVHNRLDTHRSGKGSKGRRRGGNGLR